MPFIYDDEDNVPMLDDPWDSYHNPTTYLSRAEMKAAEALPFTDPSGAGCWNCRHYNGEACMRAWKNGDPHYYNPERDDREEDDGCENWENEKK